MSSPSNLADEVTAVVGPVFVAEQTAINNAQTSQETWCSSTGIACCGIIVSKLNSEPHITNIKNLFQTEASYVGSGTSTSKNRLVVTYIIDDRDSPPHITDEEHVILSEINESKREYDVATLITNYYSKALHITTIKYDHTNGSNKKLRLKIYKYESVEP